jgi:hypothetical protein
MGDRAEARSEVVHGIHEVLGDGGDAGERDDPLTVGEQETQHPTLRGAQGA